jgi:protein gp37
MAISTSIAWTDSTWNPWIGCTKVSPGCANCYAEKMSKRRKWAAWGPGKPRRRTKTWGSPRIWNAKGAKGHRVFVASLADVFDAQVDPAWLGEVLDLIKACPNLTFQVLTKRIDEAARRLPPEIAARGGWPAFPNLWLGCTTENQDWWDARVPVLLGIAGPAKRFVSVEPMIGAIHPKGLKPDWVIVGGESGPHCRPIDPDWVRVIRDYSVANGIPFFFKQWGGIRPKAKGKTLDGREWCQVP